MDPTNFLNAILSNHTKNINTRVG